MGLRKLRAAPEKKRKAPNFRVFWKDCSPVKMFPISQLGK